MFKRDKDNGHYAGIKCNLKIVSLFSVIYVVGIHWNWFIPAGKGLTSWLSFVVSSVSLSLSHWYPGSGVVLDCIDS